MTKPYDDELPEDPVSRAPWLFPERRESRRRKGLIPSWLSFERVTGVLSSVAGILVLAYTVGGRVTSSQRDLDELRRRVESVERRVDAIEQVHANERENLRQLLDQYYVRQAELEPIRQDVKEIKALLMRRTP